jgi:ABC-type sugar transport system ATPase subunit
VNDAEPLLRLRGIGKNFGPVHALTDINLEIPAGQVTALVGDNGAGKSTLIKTIAGIWEPNGGEIIWQGKAVHFRSPRRQPRHRAEHDARARDAAQDQAA